MGEEGGDTSSPRGEAFQEGEGGRCQREAVVEVVRGIQEQGQPIFESPYHFRRVEDLTV